MSTSITTLATKLMNDTEWARMPVTLVLSNYIVFITDGIKRLYVDTNIESSWESDYNESGQTINKDLTEVEEEYCNISAKIIILKKKQSAYNDLIGYTTNALTITNVSKPHEKMQIEIDCYEKRLITLFHKMPDTANMSDIDTITVEQVEYTYES